MNSTVTNQDKTTETNVEFDAFWQEILKLRAIVQNTLTRLEEIKILEVGCGSCSYVLGIRDVRTVKNSQIIGIDISEEQLQRNPILNNRILGDIQYYDLPENEFDLIVCWWILEHLEYPEKALIKCQKSLKNNGIFVIAVPNLYSIKGLLTKLTPHSFYVWFYRNILHYPDAGIDGKPPFQTFLKTSATLQFIQKFASKNGLSVEYACFYEDPKHFKLRQKWGLVGLIWQSIHFVVKILSLGKVEAEMTDYMLVLKKVSKVSLGSTDI